MDLKLKAEDLDKTLDAKIADDVEKKFVDERHNTDNEINEASENRKTEDAVQQLSDQIKDLAQK